MLSEIGSNFWEYSTDENNKNIKFFWEDSEYNVQFLKSGRNAIKALSQCLKTQNRKVMLPIYTCDTVIQPFIDEGWSIYFYEINKNLTINSDNFQIIYKNVNPKVVFVHSFFGFNTINNDYYMLKQCQSKGSIIVEDMTQSLFSNHYIDFADYYVTSFRKFIAIPDGGALISKNDITLSNLEAANKLIADVALEAFDLKKNYFINTDKKIKEQFREKYQELNCLIGENDSLNQINDISYKIINSCDLSTICSARKSNYKYIYEILNEYSWIYPVLSEIEEGVCPLYLPVYVEKRKELQSFLAERNIYCPVIWPKSKHIIEIGKVTQYMYEHMLCIPIDQRYGLEEMNVIREALKDFNDLEVRRNG